MELRDFQRRFASALTASESDPREIFAGDESHGRAALAIYRNNVAYSLREVLAADFPTVKKLLGEDFFNGMAGEFLRQHLPERRSLSDFGAEFAGFLSEHEEAQDWLWLGDVARIEMARRQVFHAADDEPLSPHSLAGVSDENLATRYFNLRAGLKILQLSWPADEIWHAHQDGNEIAEMEIAPQEIYVLIRRSGRDVRDVIVERIGDDLAAFLQSLAGGKNLGAVMAEMLAHHADFDLSAALSQCLTNNYFKKENADASH